MKVQKLANLKQLQERHKERVRKYLLGEFLVQIVIGLTITSTGCYFLFNFETTVPFYQWFTPALIITVCLMMPLVKMSIPPEPTQDDVEASKALRRAFDMDDSVSKE
tara:strand:+ start:11383 stop:11703 length:321 start_codon:yes stop_codon:yes gene_type:complete